MNTLQAYNTIVKLVTDANQLAVKLRNDEVTKTDAMEQLKAILQETAEKIY